MIEKAGLYDIYTFGNADNTSDFREGGYGYIIVSKFHRIVESFSEGCKDTTNNREELKAVIEAVRSVPKGSRLYIHTSNRYVIDMFEKCCKPSANKELVAKFFKECGGRNITYVLLPSNSENFYYTAVVEMAYAEMDYVRFKYQLDVHLIAEPPKRNWEEYEKEEYGEEDYDD